MFSVRAPTSTRFMSALPATQRRLNGVLERISTGARINRAADDAANLGVGTNLKTHARSLAMAKRNVAGALEATNVVSNGLGEVTDRLQRMRELAVASASGTLHDDERQYLQDEYAELMSEIDRSARTAFFNGQRLLTPAPVDIAITIDSSDSMFAELPRIQAELPELATLLAAAGIEARFVVVDMNTFSDLIDGSSVHAPLGSDLTSSLTSFALTGVGGMDPYSVMLDLAGITPIAGTTTPDSLSFNADAQQKIFIHVSDVGRETLLTPVTQGQAGALLAAAGFTVYTISPTTNDATYTNLTGLTGGDIHAMNGVGVGVLAAVQSIADSIIANFVDAQTISVQAGTDGSANSIIGLAFPVNVQAHALGVASTSIDTAANALDALDALDDALDTVNSYQARVGASMNRLESTLNHQTAAIEATNYSESNVMDADFALEMSDLTRDQILMQSVMAAMAQSNNMDRGAIQTLLG